MVATNTRQLNCAALFRAKGYMPSGAASLTGNFCVESGPALAVVWRSHNLDHGSQGLAQWRGARLDAYEAFVRSKHPGVTGTELIAQYGRLDHQVDFVDQELRVDYPALHAKLKAGGLVSSLAADVCWQYERPNKALSHIADRIGHAQAIFAASNPKAQPVTIVNALDMAAAEHEQTAGSSATAVAASGVLGVAVVIHHVADDLAWWEWAALAVVAIVVVSGIVSLFQASAKATAIKSARIAVDQDVAPQMMVTASQPPLKPMPLTNAPARMTADQEEQQAIQAAIEAAKGQPIETQVAARAGLVQPVPLAASEAGTQAVAAAILGPDGTPLPLTSAHPMMSVGKALP